MCIFAYSILTLHQADTNGVYRWAQLKRTFMFSNFSVPHWRVTVLAIRWYALVTEHHPLHPPEHVGMFAGSLLARIDWDH